MTTGAGPGTWAEAVLETAVVRFDAMLEVLDDVTAALRRATHATDWQSRAAHGYHDDVETLRRYAETLHADIAALRSSTAEARHRLAAGAQR